MVITYHLWEPVCYSVRCLFPNIFYKADGSIYGNFFTHRPTLHKELIVSMISGSAIPSNEINHSFNVLINFILAKVEDLVWIIEIKRTSTALRYVNRRQKCILFENCSSICLLWRIYCHFLSNKKLNETSTSEQLHSDNNF